MAIPAPSKSRILRVATAVPHAGAPSGPARGNDLRIRPCRVAVEGKDPVLESLAQSGFDIGHQ